MSRYRKIDPRIWNDAKFRRMDERGKLVFFMLLTHPSMTALGAMRGTLGGLAEELGWTAEAFREAFAQSLKQGMVEHDQHACFIGLPKFLEYNQPESPNVVKAWRGSIDLLPECELKSRVLLRAKAFAEAKGEGYAEAFGEAFAKAMANQEQEKEKEKEPTSEANASDGEPRADKSELWAAGRSLLASQGVPAAQCGSFLGGLIQRFTEHVVLQAVRQAVVQQPAGAKGWLMATCQSIAAETGQHRKPTTHSGFEGKDYGKGFEA